MKAIFGEDNKQKLEQSSFAFCYRTSRLIKNAVLVANNLLKLRANNLELDLQRLIFTRN